MEQYTEQIKKLQEAGFKPIAVTTMMLEDTFVFETTEEAEQAFQKMEVITPGWWYGWKHFLVTLDDHKKRFQHKDHIYFIPN